jgi:putative addiction module component (TIGR02574 family)
MSESTEKLKPLLAALTREERVELVEYLTSLNNGANETGASEEELTPEEWEAAWSEEINRRIADVESGKSDSVPHKEFMRRMKEKYG